MSKQVINAKVRTTTGKRAAKKLREVGSIPAVVYNEKGEATMLEVNDSEFNTATTVITLNVDGKEYDALIKDTEYNIRTDKVLHADFFVPTADQKLTYVLKIQYSGTPAGVLKGGFMLKHIPNIKIKTNIANLPERVVVDVSKINIGETLSVKDLNLGKDVEILTDANLPIVSVSPAR